MVATTLSDEQKRNLNSYIAHFKEWLSSPAGVKGAAEHRNHEKFFKERLRPERIDAMAMNDFREVYKTLWASEFWGNKDWYIDNKLIQPNGLQKIRTELKNLLYGSEEISLRYEKFHSEIKGFGPSSITEILHFVFPDKYCLWNEKPKTVLPFLKLSILPEKFLKYQIAGGNDYQQIINALSVVRNELAPHGISDFIDLDVFFWYVYKNEITEEVKEEKRVGGPAQVAAVARAITVDSHEGAEFYLLELGKMLEYSTYTVDQSKVFENKKLGDVALLQSIPPFASARDINAVKEIDVIWVDSDENPKFCFEVEHSTDMRVGLDRLVQLQHMHARFFIVAPEYKRQKFVELTTTRFPYRRLQDRFGFISYEELADFYQTTLPFYEMKSKLLGT